MSISTHSKENKKYIIYSVYQKSYPSVYNLAKHLDHLKALKGVGIRCKQLKGIYNGDKETSVLTAYDYNIKTFALAKNGLNQESILILENYKHGLYKAKLIFREGTEQDLGYFRQVAKEIAVKYPNYTIDGDNYYITTESDTVLADELYKMGLSI